MSRSVVIASAKSNAAVKIEGFTGTTFADLKSNPQFAAIYGDGDGVEVVVKPGNTTLRGGDSVLPTENFSAFIIATKNKAGISAADARELGNTVRTAIIEKSRIASANEKETLRANLMSTLNSVYAIATNNDQPVVIAPAVTVTSAPVDPELAAALAEAMSM